MHPVLLYDESVNLNREDTGYVSIDTDTDARIRKEQGRWRIHHRAGRLLPYMRNKSILIVIVMVSSSLAGCTSDNSEEDLNVRYQEGYDAGYADAYDASYDGVAQHHYNEGWDDGWGIANSESQAEIMEMQGLASSLNQTIQSLLDEIDAGYDGAAQHHYNEGWDDGWAIANSDSEEIISDLMSNLSIQQNLVDEWIVRAINNDFSNVNLTDANLSYANLNGAILRFADLSNANLTYANLGGADLRFADLSDADLSDAYLYGADLSNVDLTGVYWYGTTCPDGTNSDDNGNTCENNL